MPVIAENLIQSQNEWYFNFNGTMAEAKFSQTGAHVKTAKG